ncbi:MAG: SRPBCC domain-containing protein [Pseudomonadota bacterium]
METLTDIKPDFVQATFIRCTQDALWDALTKADQMAAYHFACSKAEGDAVEGTTTRFLRQDGSTMLSQQTTRLDPKSLIEMTFEPNWGPDTETSRIVYRIDVEGPLCRLTTEHYQIPAGQDGVREGWARWASSLKSWLETGAALKMDV